MSTYLTLCQTVRRECRVPGSGPSSVSGQTGILKKIVEWVADADEEIQSLWADWDFLWAQWSETTIEGTAEYTKPSDLGTWDRESFYLDYSTDDHSKLTEMTYKDWRTRLRQGTKTNQQPAYFIIQPDQNIRLEAPPDDAYTLTADYWKTPTRLSDNSDTSVIPAQFERAIIELAKTKFAMDQGAQTILIAAQSAYLDWIGRLEAAQLPGHDRDRMAEGRDITVIPQ